MAEAAFRTDDLEDIPFTKEAWPPDYEALEEKRIRGVDNLANLPGDKRFNALKQAYVHYQKNPVAFIEDWCRTYDPREMQRPFMPFILFNRQKEYIYWLVDRLRTRSPGLVEKSRDMGISYVSCAFAVWAWRWIPGIKIGFGSNKELKVDRMGDMDSLFEKLRTLIEDLPPEFLPVGFKWRDHSHFMKLVNPETGASITGEAGVNIGRGGRTTMYFVDEAAHLEQPDKIDAALSANTDCRIDVSSVNGMGNPFYRKRHGGNVPVFVFDWRHDPRRDQAWYDQKVRELEPHVIAQEIDRDYTASVEGICISGKWTKAAMEIGRIIQVPASRVGKGGLDVGAGGTGRSVFVARFGPVVTAVEGWADANTTTTALKSLRVASATGVEAVNFDSVGVGAGVASTLTLVEAEEESGPVQYGDRKIKGRKIPTHGVNTGQQPTHAIWPDNKRSNEKFVNLKAELWHIMADRFRKTYELWLFLNKKEGGFQHPLDEIIILPPDAFELASQLSQVKVLETQAGKLIMESKRQLSDRGIKSPDEAEALSLTFFEQPKAQRRRISV